MLVTGAALLLLSSCAPQSPASPADPGSDSSATEAPSPSEGADEEVADEEAAEGRIDAAGAASIALEAVPGAVVELELGRQRTAIVWEAGVLGSDGSGTEVSIDSQSGEVLSQERLRLSTVQSTAPAVTAAEAIEIALDTASGRVKAMDLDTERGATVWEVVVIGTRGGTELYIDATSGTVVKQERMS